MKSKLILSVNLKQYREKNRLSQEELAARAEYKGLRKNRAGRSAFLAGNTGQAGPGYRHVAGPAAVR